MKLDTEILAIALVDHANMDRYNMELSMDKYEGSPDKTAQWIWPVHGKNNEYQYVGKMAINDVGIDHIEFKIVRDTTEDTDYHYHNIMHLCIRTVYEEGVISPDDYCDGEGPPPPDPMRCVCIRIGHDDDNKLTAYYTHVIIEDNGSIITFNKEHHI